MKRAISDRCRCSCVGSHRGFCRAALLIGLFSRFVDFPALRAEFPVLRRVAYLNAGTDGPLPARAVEAAAQELEREAREGRSSAHFGRRSELARDLRRAYAGLLGCEPRDLALTSCTSEGSDAYAGAGQKWLCGPDGTGMLYLSASLREREQVSKRCFGNLLDPDAGLQARLQEDARRFDSPSLSAETLACALAALGVLESA